MINQLKRDVPLNIQGRIKLNLRIKKYNIICQHYIMQLLIFSFLIYAISIASLIHNPSIFRKTCLLNCAKSNDLTLDISYNSDEKPKIIINNNPRNNQIILQFPPCDNIVWDNGEILWEITDEDQNDNTTSVLVGGGKPIIPINTVSIV